MAGVRRAAAILMALVLTLGVTAGVAGATKHKRKGKAWASQITLVSSTPSTFEGRVTSKLAGCRSHRLVTVYYTDPQTGQTQSLSVQRTGGAGRYQVALTTPAYAGTYQAKVSKQRIRANGEPQTCKGAQSATLRV